MDLVMVDITCTNVSVARYARPIISMDEFFGTCWELNTFFIWLMHKSMALLADTISSEHKESSAWKVQILVSPKKNKTEEALGWRICFSSLQLFPLNAPNPHKRGKTNCWVSISLDPITLRAIPKENYFEMWNSTKKYLSSCGRWRFQAYLGKVVLTVFI